MREHDLPVPDQGRKALHSERDDIFPDLHGLDLKGRLRAAFLTDRGLRLPVFCWWVNDRRAPRPPAGDGRVMSLHGRTGRAAEMFRQMEVAEIVCGFLHRRYRW